jgi:hypothetical protein
LLPGSRPLVATVGQYLQGKSEFLAVTDSSRLFSRIGHAAENMSASSLFFIAADAV